MDFVSTMLSLATTDLCAATNREMVTASDLFFFLSTYLFCRTVQPGLNTFLFNINFAEGRPSLVSDLNIVAAILAARQPLANDDKENFFFT